MDNPVTLTTLGTQDTGRRQAKENKTHRKLKWWVTRTPQIGVNPGARER